MTRSARDSFARWLAAIVLLPLAARAAATDPVRTLTIASTAAAADGRIYYTGVNGRVSQEGWLAAQLRARGVELRWMPVPGDVGATINEAFAAHRIDFASYGDLPSVILNASGTRTQMIVPCGRGMDTFLLVPLASKARSLEDLVGKRIAVHRGRPWYLAFLRLVQQSGLRPSDFTLVNIDLQPSAAALASGSIEGLFAINSYTLADRGLGRIIWSSKGRLDEKIRAELWGAKSFTDAHPDLTQLVATAYVRAQYWEAQEANREQVIEDVTRNGTPEKAAREEYSDATLAWKDYFTPIPDEAVLEHYRRTVAFAEAQHLIRAPLRAEDLLQTRFVMTALEQLGLQHFWSETPLAPTPLAVAAESGR